MSNMQWTAEQIKLLRILWLQPLTCRQIAEQLGCSHNAIIGKAHRLGLPLKKPSHLSVSPSGRTWMRSAPSAPKLKKPRPKDGNITPLYLPIWTLSYHQCRWPYGNGPEYTFCGRPCIDDKRSYCESHHRRTIRGKETRRVA